MNLNRKLNFKMPTKLPRMQCVMISYFLSLGFTQVANTLLERDEAYNALYNDWKLKDVSRVLEKLKVVYESGFFGSSNPDCEVIRTSSYSSLWLRSVHEFDTLTCRFLMDYLRERILDLGYTSYTSDRRISVSDGGERQVVERHYLKPDIFEAVMDGRQTDRRFGNITLELFLQNDTADYFRLMQTYYHEREGNREKGLDELMQMLLTNA